MSEHEGQGAKGGGQKPVGEDEGEQGLGSKTGGEGGPERTGAESLGDGGASTGPVKDVESAPGDGDAVGPTPSGVAQEGGVDPDPDTATGSTEGGPNPADD